MAHVKGNGCGVLFHIHRRLASETNGDASCPEAAEETAPAQCLHRAPGTGKDGIVPYQVVVTRFHRLVQGLQIVQDHVAISVPLHLAGQLIGPLPVKLRGIPQVRHSVVPGFQLHALLNGPIVVIEAPHAGDQEVGNGHRRQNPAQPPEEIPAKQDHEANGHCHGHQEHPQNDLPNAEIHPGTPASQKLLNRLRGERIRHIQQQAVVLSQLLHQPGQNAKHSSHNDAAQVSHRKRSPFGVSLRHRPAQTGLFQFIIPQPA